MNSWETPSTPHYQITFSNNTTSQSFFFTSSVQSFFLTVGTPCLLLFAVVILRIKSTRLTHTTPESDWALVCLSFPSLGRVTGDEDNLGIAGYRLHCSFLLRFREMELKYYLGWWLFSSWLVVMILMSSFWVVDACLIRFIYLSFWSLLVVAVSLNVTIPQTSSLVASNRSPNYSPCSVWQYNLKVNIPVERGLSIDLPLSFSSFVLCQRCRDSFPVKTSEY